MSVRDIDTEILEQVVKKTITLQRRIDNIAGSNVVIYGAGKHTRKMMSCIDLSNVVVRICDKVKKGRIGSIDIESPSKDLINWADYVVVSSVYFSNSILEDIAKYGGIDKIYKIYDEDNSTAFYQADINPYFLLEIEEIDNSLDKISTWIPEGSGEKYDKTMEKDFFDAVTKEIFLKYIESDDNVLEIGAGTGRLSVPISERGAKLTAVDTSQDMLNILKKKLNNIETYVVVDEKLPFESNSFDKIVACDVMVHFEDWTKFLKEHTRVCKPGGLIVYNIVNDDHLKCISENRIIRKNYTTGNQNTFSTTNRKTAKRNKKEPPYMDDSYK